MLFRSVPLLRDGGFNACIVCGWYLKSYLQAIRACRRAGVPLFLRGDSQLATPRSALVRAGKHLPYRWLLRRAEGHLYVGEANREYLRHYRVAESQLFFVPHFVDNAFFGRSPPRRARLGPRPESARRRAPGTAVACSCSLAN